jgi:hypothetical protein
MHWGVVAISAAHLYQNYLEEPPNPRETSERMNFNVIDKKLKTVYILISDVFFHKKMSQNFWATIIPFGPVTLIYSFQALQAVSEEKNLKESTNQKQELPVAAIFVNGS